MLFPKVSVSGVRVGVGWTSVLGWFNEGLTGVSLVLHFICSTIRWCRCLLPFIVHPQRCVFIGACPHPPVFEESPSLLSIRLTSQLTPDIGWVTHRVKLVLVGSLPVFTKFEL